MSSHSIEAVKEKRDRWSKEYDEAAIAMQQYQQMLAANNASNSVDVNMTKEGSIFNVGKDKKVEGTNGAGAASTSTNTTNNQGSDTQYDTATQNTPTGPITQPTGSGTVATSSALTDTKSANNDSHSGDYVKQQKERVKKEFKDAENTFADYQGFLAQYLKDGLSDSGIGGNDGISDQLKDILGGNTNTNDINNTGNQTDQNPTNPNDASDPTKTDMAYKDPDNDIDNESEEQKIVKQMEQDALKQNSLFNQYTQNLKPEEINAQVA